MEKVKFNFEDLKVYDKALDFVDSVYALTKKFPVDERFGLKSQFIRASTSIALNIAEGAGDSNPQFNRYLQISQDSIRECVVCLTISLRQNYISEDDNVLHRRKLSEIAKMITNLQKYLKK